MQAGSKEKAGQPHSGNAGAEARMPGIESLWSAGGASASALQSFVQSLGNTMQKALSGMPIPALTQLQQEYVKDASDLYLKMIEQVSGKPGNGAAPAGKTAPVMAALAKDKRFASEAWHD